MRAQIMNNQREILSIWGRVEMKMTKITLKEKEMVCFLIVYAYMLVYE
jgi:hypothetical protein